MYPTDARAFWERDQVAHIQSVAQMIKQSRTKTNLSTHKKKREHTDEVARR